MIINFKKSKQELQEEINKNDELIKKNNKNAKILEVNTFENKLQFFLGTSFFIYWIPYFIMLFMKFPSFPGLSPFQTFPLITIGSTLLVSVPLTVKRNNKASKLLNQISSAKTGKEILLEKTMCELEVEKLKNKNEAIKKAIHFISKEESILEHTNKEENTKDIDKNNIGQTILSLKENENEMDTISTKKFLNEKFFNIRNKYEGLINNIIQVVMPVTVISMLSITFPYSLIGTFHTFSTYHNINSTLAVLMPALIPLSLSIGGSILYLKNIANKEKKVFRKINSTLGKGALSTNENNNEIHLDKQLDSKIEELSNIIIANKKNKRIIETCEKYQKDKTNVPNEFTNNPIECIDEIDLTTEGPIKIMKK